MTGLKWLGAKRPYAVWGLPHKRGSVKKEDAFVLKSGECEYGVITTPTAFWNDGSVKWTAHRCVFDGDIPDKFKLVKGSAEIHGKLNITETPNAVTVDTGAVVCEIPKRGEKLISCINAHGQKKCLGAELVLEVENRYITEGYESRVIETFHGDTTECIIEESNAARAVVLLKGRHLCKNAGRRHNAARSLIPFNIRLYLYTGSDEIRITYTMLFDGQPNTDFIRGAGIRITASAGGALYNRHVRFGGESGVYSDSPKGLLTWRTTGKYKELYARQNECREIGFDSEADADFLGLLDESAVWDSFRIKQLSSEEYIIEKNVGEGLCYIKGHSGHRAAGTAAVTDKDGGVYVYMDRFWEKYPSSLQCERMTTDTPKITAWLWPPQAEPMDLRHYDTRCHVYSGYEGFDEMRATPYGIANTNELVIKVSAQEMTNGELAEWGSANRQDSLLIPSDLNFYREAGVLGKWSMPSYETDERAAIERQLEDIFEYYKNEIEQRRWYGFWDYGDFMHTYDDVHHCWKYDMGGQAWQNTELVPNLWLWYSFLRTGREDYFAAAKAMTRHTSEVDVYHFGEYKGLGSRHNVVHWGCGCKEARINMTFLHKIYAYITCDERVLELMDEAADIDYAVGELDPMRAYYPPDSRFPTHVRFGPDVMTFCSNWFTYYERHLDEEYLEKLRKTLSFFKQGYRFVLSSVYGYNPKTTQYYDFEVQGGSHFMLCFGNFWVWTEIADAFDDDEIKELLAVHGRMYGQNADDERFRRDKCAEWGYPEIADNGLFKHKSYNVAESMYAAERYSDAALKDEIMYQITHDEWVPFPIKETEVNTPDYHRALTEVKGMNTNGVSQWCLNVITALYYADKFEAEERN